MWVEMWEVDGGIELTMVDELINWAALGACPVLGLPSAFLLFVSVTCPRHPVKPQSKHAYSNIRLNGLTQQKQNNATMIVMSSPSESC